MFARSLTALMKTSTATKDITSIKSIENTVYFSISVGILNMLLSILPAKYPDSPTIIYYTAQIETFVTIGVTIIIIAASVSYKARMMFSTRVSSLVTCNPGL